jgi:hypothetical protein
MKEDGGLALDNAFQQVRVIFQLLRNLWQAIGKLEQ